MTMSDMIFLFIAEVASVVAGTMATPFASRKLGVWTLLLASVRRGSATEEVTSDSSTSTINTTELCRINAWNGSTAIVSACIALSAEEFANDEYCKAQVQVARLCDGVCPFTTAPDVKYQCEEEYNTLWRTFTSHLQVRDELQWDIFFLCFFTLAGAASKLWFPKWLPYTVGLLIIGVAFGVIAQSSASVSDCPWLAILHDENEDRVISREEYGNFVCENCHKDSFCVVDSWGARRRTCWDGSSPGSGCRWSFDALDSSWRKSFMSAETASNIAGNGELEFDELWTVQCNLMREMLQLSDIDPHTLLVVFLPALLFESACFGLDFGIFRKELVQILLLAFPAMVAASGVTGVLVYAANGGAWNFWPCWLIGVILSATDPVAVVALLKDLGASKSLSTLIEGESLLNDGSAVVLYTWVRNVIGYDSLTNAPSWMARAGQYNGEIGIELMRVIAQMLLLGVVLGWGGGFLLRSALRRVYNDGQVEAALVLGSAYLLYWFGELIMQSSAVIAVVVMGLYLNYHKEAFSPDCHRFLHEMFGMIAYLMNTIIFSIAGARLGTLFVAGSFVISFDRINWVIIYPVVLLARAVAIGMFYPLLQRTGNGCTWREAVVMWWGGLRGTIGLALALVVYHTIYSASMWGPGEDVANGGFGQYTGRLDCRDLPTDFLLMTVFVVFMTVVVNGMTMAPLMRLLQMGEIPDARKFMLKAAQKKLTKGTDSLMARLKKQKVFERVSWDYVDAKKLVMTGEYVVQDPQKAAWLQVLNIERAQYVHQFEHGRLGSEAFMKLEAFMATLNAHADTTPGPELSRKYHHELTRFVQHLIKVKTRKRLMVACQVAMAYIKGQQHLQHSVHVGEGDEMTELYNKVKTAHDANVEVMVSMLLSLQDDYPDVVGEVMDSHAAGLVLHHQRDMVERMVAEGQLQDLDALTLLAMLNKRLKQLYVEAVSFKMEAGDYRIRKVQVQPSRRRKDAVVISPSVHQEMSTTTGEDNDSFSNDLVTVFSPVRRVLRKPANEVALDFCVETERSESLRRQLEEKH